MTVVGYVTKSVERTSKNGNLFGEYTLIDYYGDLKFPLFRDDYSNYKGNLCEGYSIIMDVEIRENKYQSNKQTDNNGPQLSVYYRNIRMLQNLKTKSINLYIDISNIDSVFRKQFANIIDTCSGETELYITLFDTQNSTRGIKMVSRTKQIDINREELREFIESNDNVIKKVVITQ
jgi:DNA polymerase III alpha subunit